MAQVARLHQSEEGVEGFLRGAAFQRRKIRSRGFDKTRRRTMRGKVVPR